MFNEKVFATTGGSTATIEAPHPEVSTTVGGPPPVVTAGRTMTIGGTCAAAGLMIVALVAGAWYGWGKVVVLTTTGANGQSVNQASLQSPGWLIGAAIFAFVVAMATVFMPKIARFSWLPYSLAEGVVLGLISHLYDTQTKGIAIQAVVATIGVFALMLLLYGLRVLRATPRFTKGVIAATFGVMAIYLVSWIASLFGSDLNLWSSSSPLSIGISLVIVGVAALNFILDFDFIERGATAGLPSYMEWYGAFGLVLTLVWLYLEMLRLLSKLQR